MEKDREKEMEAYLLRLLAKREYSTFMLLEKLRGKFPEEREDVFEILIKKFVQKGWVSNTRFQEAFIRDQIAKGFGPRAIALKLKQKGIALSPQAIEADYTPALQQALQRLLAKKRRNLSRKRLSPFQEREALMQYALARGFFASMVQDFLSKK